MPISISGANKRCGLRALATVAPGDTNQMVLAGIALDYFLRFPTPPTLNSTSDAPSVVIDKSIPITISIGKGADIAINLIDIEMDPTKLSGRLLRDATN